MDGTMSTPHTSHPGTSTPHDRTPRWARLFLPAHRWLYQRTGGLLGHRLGPQRTLLLTTIGRKTGRPRTLPITYFRHPSGRLFIVASNWGGDRPPAWYLNILAAPQVGVQLKRETFVATARTADAGERATLWPWLVARSPNFGRYQAVASREIPIVLLEREATPH
jgi:deazaflavin-dependent oxidoreductase (nitroreductase family)